MEGQIRKWSLGLNPVKSVKTVLIKQSSADNRKKIKLQGSSKKENGFLLDLKRGTLCVNWVHEKTTVKRDTGSFMKTVLSL